VGDEEVLTGAIGDDIYDTGMLLWADYCFCPSTAHNGVIDIVTNVAKTTGQGLVIPKMYKAGINLYRWTSELFASWALESGR
jgi:3-deoxy-D-manno-octulosonate 8-phosphate phosphatase KdsC-like HAD superfamily phosphatase